MCSSVSFRAFRAFGFFPVISLSICGLRSPVLRGFRLSDSRDMVQEIAVRQALPQCLWGSFEFVVKMAFLDWEAAVLPLNYARGGTLISRDRAIRQAPWRPRPAGP
jgi:hypothetical protein